ncbi:L,D-transpeptidase catalytic domain [Pseudobutyrivibrio sp. 49]|uniref:L,D-transpeptidase n=1 Tax=unclassified Pseudobutyrivibrio TaxID=2638619 RepID=UPI00088F03A1|nr:MULTISPECIES: L,D-transpeptidase [unclassified Pseudobutyrivibrio]SDH99767.1 L,D-transpeptidase catalytic domain [Pseudobutyrivibrio sp. 49]SFN98350.1 L,D-transpeptidase catalytic domain [Pseudobutyrivibrio sp. UC1225]
MKIIVFLERISLAFIISLLVGFFGSGKKVEAAELPNYAIYVNRAANCVTVYSKDEQGMYTVPERSFLCSVGRNIEDTPTGLFQTTDYYEWRKLFGNTYGRYAIRFNGHILFHSVPYSQPSVDALYGDAFNMLGEGASAGCVRMAVADLKWIYDNCKVGTYVVVYDDLENPGPLGKPNAVKINLETGYGNYDPTEVAAYNPWVYINPTQYLKQDNGDGIVYAYKGVNYETLKDYIGLKDSNGADIEKWNYSLELNGKYDLNTPGTYTVWVTGKANSGLASQQQYTVVIM